MNELLYQGHASFRLTSDKGTVVYIDPYAGEGYEPKADAVFCTHEHKDHCSVEKINLKENAPVYRQADMLIDGKYKTVELDDVTVRAVPAYNDKHPKETTVGFVISMGNKKIYIPGDTNMIPEMKELASENIDYAFFPTDGFFNMGPEEASECARIVNAGHSTPIHTCKNTDGIFNEENALKFNANGRIILHPQETITWQ